MWFLNTSSSLSDFLIRLISIAIIVLLILPLHEYAHARVAYKLGDSTAKNVGRLTINPFKSVDIIGALAMFVFGFGWAKAVPVNPNRFKNPKKGMALTAVAGPIVNLIAGFICCFLQNLVNVIYISGAVSYDTGTWIYSFLYFCGTINIGLAVFNILPIPPLDGSRVLAAFLPDSAIKSYYKYQKVLLVIVFVLIYMGALTTPLYLARTAIYDLFNSITCAILGFRI